MAVEDDVREIRGHVLDLVGAMGRLEGTLKAYERPCPDVKAAHIRMDKLEVAPAQRGGATELVRNEQGIVRLLIGKVVGPLVAAVTGVLAYIFAAKG